MENTHPLLHHTYLHTPPHSHRFSKLEDVAHSAPDVFGVRTSLLEKAAAVLGSPGPI